MPAASTACVLDPDELASLPPRIVDDREMGPVLLLLSEPSIARRAAPFLDVGDFIFRWCDALDQRWSPAERVLVEAAAALWSLQSHYDDGEHVRSIAALAEVVSTVAEALAEVVR